MNILLFVSVLPQSDQIVTLIVPTAGNCQDDVTLLCRVSTGDSISHSRKWYLDGTIILSRGQTHYPDKYIETIDGNDIKLTVKLFSLEDVGSYSCQNGSSILTLITFPFECKYINSSLIFSHMEISFHVFQFSIRVPKVQPCLCQLQETVKRM